MTDNVVSWFIVAESGSLTVAIGLYGSETDARSQVHTEPVSRFLADGLEGHVPLSISVMTMEELQSRQDDYESLLFLSRPF